MSVVIISWFGYTNGSLAFPTFGTVVSRGRTNATPHPLTKLCSKVGSNSDPPEADVGVVTTCRQWPFHVDAGMAWVLRIHAILWRCRSGHCYFVSGHCSDILDDSELTRRSSMSELFQIWPHVTIVNTTTSRWHWLVAKKIGGQLGKFPNK